MITNKVKLGGEQLPLILFPDSEEISPIIPSLLNQKEKAASAIRISLQGNRLNYLASKRPLDCEIEYKNICNSIEFLKQILGRNYACYIP